MEGFGLVALESIMNDLPVLCSGIEGISDAIRNEQNGFVVESGDAEAWGRMINSLLNDERSLKECSKRFKEFTLSNFGWDKMCREYALCMGILEPVARPLKSYKAYVKTVISKAS